MVIWLIRNIRSYSEQAIRVCKLFNRRLTMPSNVEIKAHVSDLEALKEKAVELSNCDASVLVQEDTFFKTPQGRLKLRVLKDATAQLIYYERSDEKGPKSSEYHITLIDDPENLKLTLGKAYGIKGVVKKTRFLYMVGQTRVHVDEVQDLGDFMELEVVMRPDQTTEEGQKIAEGLMEKLGIKEENLLDGAYMDMIMKQKK